jgi:flavin reductase (DIM6/NTAB) family NADH-FMN oxidoreductase RutF
MKKLGGMKMREVKITEVSDKILEQLPKGVFLTVKGGDKVNTMTIGWGTIGTVWMKPMFMVMVRYSRYTYELIEKADSFTVSVPLGGNLKGALALCGSKSGRDIDKFKDCNLTQKPGVSVNSPSIAECDIIVECEIKYKQPLNPEQIPQSVKDRLYKDNDYHVLYFGEIKKVFKK